MTNHIEEMMRTAGIKGKTLTTTSGITGIPIGEVYPMFTAEKQLEIIKLIGQEGILEIDKLPVSKLWQLKTYSQQSGNNQDFTQALAQLTTELMKAGELDKSKVKEILE